MAVDLACTGEGINNDHCCYVDGKTCAHLVTKQGGRKYACGLMLRHGSWELVNKDPDYEYVGFSWQRAGLPFNYCEIFDPSLCCRKDH